MEKRKMEIKTIAAVSVAVFDTEVNEYLTSGWYLRKRLALTGHDGRIWFIAELQRFVDHE